MPSLWPLQQYIYRHRSSIVSEPYHRSKQHRRRCGWSRGAGWRVECGWKGGGGGVCSWLWLGGVGLWLDGCGSAGHDPCKAHEQPLTCTKKQTIRLCLAHEFRECAGFTGLALGVGSCVRRICTARVSHWAGMPNETLEAQVLAVWLVYCPGTHYVATMQA